MIAVTNTGPTALWYFARGSGFAALVLLTLSVAGGILVSTRYQDRGWPRFVVQDLHRSISLLVLVFLTLHIVTAVVDPYAHLGPTDALLPFGSAYRAVWLGLGVVASELLVALVVTSLVRHRLGFRAWRVVHWVAYMCWPIALVHGMGTGTDTRSFWGFFVDLGCVGVVVLAVGWRLSWGWPRYVVRRVALGGLFAAALVALAGWTMAGPLRAGWARAAGTPPSLLTGATQPGTSAASAPSAAPTPSPTPARGVPAGLREQLQGTAVQTADGAATVNASTSGNPPLSIVLTVPAENSSASPQLVISEGTQTLCSAPASLERAVVALCGSTVVQLRLQVSDDGGVLGVLSTGVNR